MGTVTFTKFQCDRCGCMLDKKPSLSTPRIKIRIEIEEEWHSQSHAWNELCAPCNVFLTNNYRLLLPTKSESAK